MFCIQCGEESSTRGCKSCAQFEELDREESYDLEMAVEYGRDDWDDYEEYLFDLEVKENYELMVGL